MKKRMTFGVIAAECSREYTSQVLGGIIEQGFACDADIFVLSAVNKSCARPTSTSWLFPTALTALSMTETTFTTRI